MSRNGPGWSPDGGSFWRKDGKIYWEDGAICDDGWIREMPDDPIPESEWHKYEDYSAWSDEKRAEVKAQNKIEREQYEASMKLWADGIRALRASAKTKLTEEEWDAMNTEIDDE